MKHTEVLKNVYDQALQKAAETNLDSTKLERHFSADYKNLSGASRLPTLAVYAAYQCMMGQVARYDDKLLRPLENHHSADARSGRIGDIDINLLIPPNLSTVTLHA